MSEDLTKELNKDTSGQGSTAKVPEKEGLTPENIGHLLSALGDSVIIDMLENAGMSEEDLKEALDQEQTDSNESDDASAESAESADPPDDNAIEVAEEPAAPVDDKDDTDAIITAHKKKKARKRKRKIRFLFLIIFILIALIVGAFFKIMNSVTINSNDPIQYSEQVDDISADEGSLNVNNVSVKVPTDGSEEYSISYSWAEDDDKYPSVPYAITAIYHDDEGNTMYSISLYRSDSESRENSKSKGKNIDNWFDDWTTVTEGDVLQVPLNTGGVNGFYIYPQSTDEEKASEYNDYSFYFPVKTKKNINTYVIEGVCVDPTRAAEFQIVMENCIHGISIK